ncbi:unnamed protein product [Soboliphyme baturini]|uniref:Peptidase_M1 domain-containing protein n=1 Tax=Soboliphyme baturini TaxID=241478 RepID=A0A183IV14_9BILA|nr:unnamed protein product [Soboliphyme baturini]
MLLLIILLTLCPFRFNLKSVLIGKSVFLNEGNFTFRDRHSIISLPFRVNCESLFNSTSRVNTIMPTDYFLTVQPYFPPFVLLSDPKVFTFDGQYKMHMRCVENTSLIVMNSREISIEVSTLSLREVNESGDALLQLPTPSIQYDERLQTVGHFYSLSFNYTGLLGDSMEGFYRTPVYTFFFDRWLAVTDFECCAARMALPCFDEPRFKAVFHLEIIHPTSMVALANNEKNSDEDYGTTFKPSPKMSSYLLAFTVCEFNHTEKVTVNGVLVSSVKLLLFNSVLPYYAAYFDRKFPLPKQDMLAVPDFEAGAMENWGLVTYRETALLYNTKTCWKKNRDRVATVVAHELAHQWFGDLVTMQWWNDIWLNEGFARLFEYFGAGYILNEPTRVVISPII